MSYDQQDSFKLKRATKVYSIDVANKSTEVFLDLKSECTSIPLRDHALVERNTDIYIECVDESNGVKILVADRNDVILETIFVEDERSNVGNSGSDFITYLKSGSSSLSQSCDS